MLWMQWSRNARWILFLDTVPRLPGLDLLPPDAAERLGTPPVSHPGRGP